MDLDKLQKKLSLASAVSAELDVCVTLLARHRNKELVVFKIDNLHDGLIAEMGNRLLGNKMAIFHEEVDNVLTDAIKARQNDLQTLFKDL